MGKIKLRKNGKDESPASVLMAAFLLVVFAPSVAFPRVGAQTIKNNTPEPNSPTGMEAFGDCAPLPAPFDQTVPLGDPAHWPLRRASLALLIDDLSQLGVLDT